MKCHTKILIWSSASLAIMFLTWCGVKAPSKLLDDSTKNIMITTHSSTQSWNTVQQKTSVTNFDTWLFTNIANAKIITRDNIISSIKEYNNSITDLSHQVDIDKITPSQLPDYIAKLSKTNENGITQEIYINVKSLSWLDETTVTKIKQELLQTNIDAQYIMRNIFPDNRRPMTGWGEAHYEKTYDLPKITIPGSTQSRVFAYFGWQSFPMIPWVRILYIKNNHLIGITYADTDYLSNTFMDGYMRYYEWFRSQASISPNFMNLNYINAHKSEFESSVRTLVEKLIIDIGIY